MKDFRENYSRPPALAQWEQKGGALGNRFFLRKRGCS